MTDKVQKIREEVVRMHNLLPVMDGDNISVNYADRICTTLEMYIDSLQEEPVSEELEEAARSYSDNLDNICGSIGEQVRNSFKAGAKWKLKQDQETIELAEDHAMLAGMEKMKEQMMKNALDGEVIEEQVGRTGRELRLSAYIPYELGFKDGDKVKLIIIKEE